MSINLVTGGCSFTEYVGCWPYWLIRKLRETHSNSDLALHNTGVGGGGNALTVSYTHLTLPTTRYV